jgi:tRNA-modifying protein YgfZ
VGGGSCSRELIPRAALGTVSAPSGSPDIPPVIPGYHHVGDPLGEQKRFIAGDAVIALPHHHVISISGPDRLTWLDSLSSQFLVGLPPHHTTENLILSPQGRVEHRFLIVDDGDTSWLLTEPGTATSLLAWLDKMTFRADVQKTDHSDDMALFALWSKDADDLTLPHGSVVWRDPWPGVEPGGFAYSDTDHPGAGFSLIYVALPAGDKTFAEWERAGTWALDAVDIRAGRPSLRHEVDDKTLPHEVDWLRTAVHLNKGCYRGQETVAKVHNLGHPPRRLVLLHLDGSGSALPEPGAEVVAGEKTVGYVTRSATHYEWGPLALAFIKRSVPGDEPLVVVVGDTMVAASQEVLVSPDAGRVNAPRLPGK